VEREALVATGPDEGAGGGAGDEFATDGEIGGESDGALEIKMRATGGRAGPNVAGGFVGGVGGAGKTEREGNRRRIAAEKRAKWETGGAGAKIMEHEVKGGR